MKRPPDTVMSALFEAAAIELETAAAECVYAYRRKTHRASFHNRRVAQSVADHWLTGDGYIQRQTRLAIDVGLLHSPAFVDAVYQRGKRP